MLLLKVKSTGAAGDILVCGPLHSGRVYLRIRADRRDRASQGLDSCRPRSRCGSEPFVLGDVDEGWNQVVLIQ